MKPEIKIKIGDQWEEGLHRLPTLTIALFGALENTPHKLIF